MSPQRSRFTDFLGSGKNPADSIYEKQWLTCPYQAAKFLLTPVWAEMSFSERWYNGVKKELHRDSGDVAPVSFQVCQVPTACPQASNLTMWTVL